MYKPTIKMFGDYLKLSKSSATVYSYSKYIRYFFDWYEKAPIYLRKKDLIKYFQKIKDENKSSTNINVTKAALKSYFKFLNNIACREFLSLNIFNNIDAPLKEHNIQKVVNYTDIKPIIKFLRQEPHDFLRIRSIMILLIFATTGARRMEVASLKLQNIDLISGSIQFMRTKRNKPRISYIPSITIKYIKRYLQLRHLYVKKNNEMLIISKNGYANEKTSFCLIQNLYIQIRKQFPNFTLHAMRRGYALDLYNNGAELAEVSKLLGHANSSTTIQCYLLFHDRTLRKSAEHHPAYSSQK